MEDIERCVGTSEPIFVQLLSTKKSWPEMTGQSELHIVNDIYFQNGSVVEQKDEWLTGSNYKGQLLEKKRCIKKYFFDTIF